MAGYQQTTIVGNVGRVPEMRYLTDGTPVTNFSVAVTEKYKEKETTTWYDVTCWRKLAEIANQYVTKGKQVLVVGRLKLETYTKKDGGAGAKLVLTADTFKLLGSKADSSEEGAAADPMGAAPEAPAFDNLPF